MSHLDALNNAEMVKEAEQWILRTKLKTVPSPEYCVMPTKVAEWLLDMARRHHD